MLPRLKIESELIQKALEGTNNTEKKAAEHLETILIKHCAMVIIKTRSAPDIHVQFINEFGYLGSAMCNKVLQLRNSMNSQGRTPSTPLTPNTPK